MPSSSLFSTFLTSDSDAYCLRVSFTACGTLSMETSSSFSSLAETHAVIPRTVAIVARLTIIFDFMFLLLVALAQASCVSRETSYHSQIMAGLCLKLIVCHNAALHPELFQKLLVHNGH